MDLVSLLREAGLATPDVLAWLNAEVIETVDDLAHAFRTADAVRAQPPHLIDAWLLASRYQTEAWRGIVGVSKLMSEMRQASLHIASVARPGPPKAAPARRTEKRQPRGKPRPKTVALSRDRDKVARTKAAAAAVELSLAWAPGSGIAQGLKPTDPLVAMVKEVYLDRLALFEPKGLWTVVNNWRAWEEHLAKYAVTRSAPEIHVLLETFLRSKPSASGSLAA